MVEKVHKFSSHCPSVCFGTRKEEKSMKVEEITHIQRRHCVFFPFNFCLWMWHGTKSIGVWCHNMVPNYVTYDVYVIYTTILDLDYWVKIIVVAN
jgi:hypothetical protein